MHYMIILMLILYLLGNGYIFWRLWSLLVALPMWAKVSVTILYWVVALMLAGVFAFRNASIPEWLLKTMYVLGSSWLVFVLYMVMALLITDVVKLFVPSFTNGFLWALGTTVVVLIWGYCNYRNTQVEHIDVQLDKPIANGQLKIVAVSDVHLGYGTGKSAAKRYVDLINAQQPDVVLIAGDLIDNSLRPLVSQRMEEELRQIKAPQGVWLVPGNHEHISDIAQCKQFLAAASITMLVDSVVTLPGGVQIVGRDDRINRCRKSLETIMEGVDANKPIVMLDHQPFDVAKKDSLGIDLQLSGHTHRGQVWPLNLLVDKMFEQSHGYRRWTHSHVYVSSGLSLWGPPFRIGTNSDMAVITLTSKK